MRRASARVSLSDPSKIIRFSPHDSSGVVGVVLAAGRSSRMGTPKALLPLDGRTFIERIIDAMREGGCTRVIVVTGVEATGGGAEVAQLAESLGANVVVNPVVGSEQIDSLRLALRSAGPDAAAVVMSPVDSPAIEASIVQGLLASIQDGAEVAVPTFGGRRGHPVAFSGELIKEFLEGDLPEGARTVFRRHAAKTRAIPVEDAGVLLDIDTPEDYSRLREVRG